MGLFRTITQYFVFSPLDVAISDSIVENSLFLSLDQWGSKGSYNAKYGSSSRGPSFSIFIPHLHRMINFSPTAIGSKWGFVGTRIYRGALLIIHLLHADDSLIFCKASKVQSEKLFSIL